jgi:carboxyl-terminal processing protease
MKHLPLFVPLFCGTTFALGIFIGSYLNGSPASSNQSYDKLKAVLGIVQHDYVDSVNSKKLVDETIGAMLDNLDPHSGYYSVDETRAMNEPLQGNFQGIGIEYNIVRDTVIVVSVIKGGPSEVAGLRSGDRLLTADNASLTGESSQEKSIREKLRGPGGTSVNVSVLRRKKKLEFSITRGTVPIYSVDVAYMMNQEVGYLKLARFAETSYEEFKKATDDLLKSGMKKMIFDLRGNGGGVLESAVDIADEFLASGKMIVYTKGRVEGRIDYRATAKGRLEKISLVVLVDENSASASEIIAGAIQDNDRGKIVGRRTFGKGLVQENRRLADGSGFRLTIARYYTPTGRCIQKPYDKGHAAYEEEERDRYKRGELFSADSIRFADSLKFKTPAGKIVYGGGGIMPDVFVPLDTSGNSSYLNELFFNNVFTPFGLDYKEKNIATLEKMGRENFIASFVVSDALRNQFLDYATESGVARSARGEANSDTQIRLYMKAYIGRVMWDDLGFYPVWNAVDPAVKKALEVV